MTEDPARVVQIERTYDASAEDVFDAWTSEDVLRRWFSPGPAWETPTAQVDLRVGGRIRVQVRNPADDFQFGASGEYTAIERPHRLAFTWVFDDDPSNEQMIELEFTEEDGATTVRFVNSNIPPQRRESQESGWSGFFDNLAGELAR